MSADAQLLSLLEGLCAAWGVPGAAAVASLPTGAEGRIDRPGAATVVVRRTRAGFGFVWEVGLEGERLRAHASAQGAVAGLAALLAPERPAGRVLFAGGDQAP